MWTRLKWFYCFFSSIPFASKASSLIYFLCSSHLSATVRFLYFSISPFFSSSSFPGWRTNEWRRRNSKGNFFASSSHTHFSLLSFSFKAVCRDLKKIVIFSFAAMITEAPPSWDFFWKRREKKHVFHTNPLWKKEKDSFFDKKRVSFHARFHFLFILIFLCGEENFSLWRRQVMVGWKEAEGERGLVRGGFQVLMNECFTVSLAHSARLIHE